MTTNFEFKLYSPMKPFFDSSVSFVSVPAHWGQLQVGPDHTPFVTTVESGVLEVSTSQGSLQYFVSKGVFSVKDNVASLASELVEEPTALNMDRAKKAEERALKRLSLTTSSDIDIPRALRSLKRAKARQLLREKP